MSRHRAILSAACVVLATTAGSVAAQSGAFDSRMDAALADAGDRADLVSCLGLFRSFRLYFGADTQAGDQARLREVDMTVVTSVVWQGATGMTLEAAMADILPLADTATALYTERFEANHADTGDLLDAGLIDRLTPCDALCANLVEALP